MSALKKLIVLWLLALFSTAASAVTDAEVFTYAAAHYPSLFAGAATAGQYQQYTYRYYPASGNFLAIDTSGVVSIAGAAAGGKITAITTVAALAHAITDWKSTLSTPIAPEALMGGSIQKTALELAGSVTTFAGSVPAGARDGTGAAAAFNNPTGVTTDGTNLYVADFSNNKIRKVVIATGAVTTLAGSGEKSSVDGVGANATFDGPAAITTDGANLYVTDLNDARIRKIVIATGAVTTLAGSGIQIFSPLGFGNHIIPGGGCANGIGTGASFSLPFGITTDGVNLYVADTNCNMIRKIVIATGEVTSLVGGEGGPWTPTGLHGPYGITTDGTNLYVTDRNSIRKIVIATGAMTTLAGGDDRLVPCVWNKFGCSADGTGAAATFSYPQDITTDGANLYVVDWASGLIRKVVIATGAVTTLAGSARGTSAVDGNGMAAWFNGPAGITTDGVSLYVADQASANGVNNSIRKIQ